MARLRLCGALQSLDLEIPLEALVAVTCATGRSAERLALDLIAAEGQRKMAPLLSPTWLPALGRLATSERGEVHGLRPTFVFRHADAVWPCGTRVGDVLGVVPALAALLGCRELDRCMTCAGQGLRASVDAASLVVDGSLSLTAGAIAPWAKRNSKFYQGVLEALAATTGLSLDEPWDSLSKAMQTLVLYGSPDTNFKGVVFDVERRLAKSGEGRGDDSVSALAPYLQQRDCEACDGTGLGPAALAPVVGGASLGTLYRTELRAISEFVGRIGPLDLAPGTADRLVTSIVKRIELAAGLELAHFALGMRVSDLPPAEASRIRIAQVLGSGLQHALFVMESPVAQQAPANVPGILTLLRQRVRAGDSILVVERDARVLKEADCVVAVADGSEPGSVVLVSQGPYVPPAL